MRRILVETARRKGPRKHGGGGAASTLDAELAVDSPADDLLALDDALTRLAAGPGRRLVELRFFAGLTLERGGRRGPRPARPHRGTGTGPTPGPGSAGNSIAAADCRSRQRTSEFGEKVCQVLLPRYRTDWHTGTAVGPQR